MNLFSLLNKSISICTIQAKTKSKGGNEFNSAIVLSFSDFLKLLEIFALKVSYLPTRQAGAAVLPLNLTTLETSQVYPRDSADNASKRLLLENVLLLANRRAPSTSKYNLSDEEVLYLYG